MPVSSSGLRWQTNAARPDQAGVRRFEAPERPAGRTLQIDILIVGSAKCEVGGCGVIVRYRDKSEDDSARVDLDNAAKTGQCGPEVAPHVVMHAVRPAISGYEGSCLHRAERRMGGILRALRAAHGWAILEGAVPDPAASKISDGEQRVVGRHRNAVREQTAVHYLAQ